LASLDGIRNSVNRLLTAQPDAALAQEGWVHLYGVSQAAALLAGRRGLDASICAAAGLLHDIYTFRTGLEAEHARFGAAEAETMLREAGGFTEGDVRVISCMILRHSDKAASDGPYEECLKDADVLAHWLYDPMKKFNAAKKARLVKTFAEIGISGDILSE
jgi:uncharacterized protein